MMAHKRSSDELDQQIDENLRRVYADAAQEPVPDRFAKLLEQLRTRAADDAASEETTAPEDES